jgi:hypothetical protein
MPHDGDPLTFRPSYCGMPHQTSDGVPLAHRCRVLPPDAILAEYRGHDALALRVFASHAAAGRLENHPGLWRVRRR